MNENIEDSLASGKRFPLIKSRPLILGIVLGVLFLIVAFKGSTLALVGASLAKVDLIPYVVGVGMYGVYLVIRAYRWKLLLADISPILPFFPLLKATFWGTAANVVIPHSGEVLRSFMIGKSLSVPATKILGTIATERIFDFVTVILLTAFVLMIYADAPGLLVSALVTLSVMGSAIAIVMLCICARERYIKIVTNVLSKILPNRASGQLLWQFEQLAFGIQESLKTRKLFSVIAYSFLQWITITVCIFTSMIAVDINASYWVALIVLPLTIAGLTLPTAPGYLGTIQVAFLVALGGLGLPEEQALASSFVYLGVVALPVVIVSLVWYLIDKMRNQRVDGKVEKK